MSKNPLLQTLISMTGQDNVITVHRPFVEFTGSLEAAMMLSQLLYWTPKATIRGGWIAKSDKDWQKELCLTRYSHRKATEKLVSMGIIETQLRKFNGAPTIHYLILWETLESEWISWLRSSEIEQSDRLKSDNPSSEIGQSLTETTAQTTQEITFSKKPDLIDAILEQGTQANAIKEATDFFEKTFGFGVLNWDTSPTWRKFAKWIYANKDDLGAFKDYVTWRNGKGQYKGAMTNTAIRRDPQIFMDTGWPTFLAYSSMYAQQSETPLERYYKTLEEA